MIRCLVAATLLLSVTAPLCGDERALGDAASDADFLDGDWSLPRVNGTALPDWLAERGVYHQYCFISLDGAVRFLTSQATPWLYFDGPPPETRYWAPFPPELLSLFEGVPGLDDFGFDTGLISSRYPPPGPGSDPAWLVRPRWLPASHLNFEQPTPASRPPRATAVMCWGPAPVEEEEISGELLWFLWFAAELDFHRPRHVRDLPSGWGEIGDQVGYAWWLTTPAWLPGAKFNFDRKAIRYQPAADEVTDWGRNHIADFNRAMDGFADERLRVWYWPPEIDERFKKP